MTKHFDMLNSYELRLNTVSIEICYNTIIHLLKFVNAYTARSQGTNVELNRTSCCSCEKYHLSVLAVTILTRFSGTFAISGGARKVSYESQAVRSIQVKTMRNHSLGLYVEVSV